MHNHKVVPVTGDSGCVSTPCLVTQHEARDFSHEWFTDSQQTFDAAIAEQARAALLELLEKAGLKPGSILVIGCSSSEIVGCTIGHGSSFSTAQALVGRILPELTSRGIYLAAQCCEHLNRALIVERDCAQAYGLEPVCVIPQPKAGGSFATAVWQAMRDPVAVEHVRAHAGMDIGGTLIGMHLKDVAVPVRLSLDRIGKAVLLCARTRPKYIGGERAVYPKP